MKTESQLVRRLLLQGGNVDMELQVWNVFLSFLSAGALLWVKVSHDEVKRLGILISKTREEHAEKFVTKNDMHADINRVLARLDRLDEKLDAFMREQRSALN
jgi:DNA-directed RNA polymerase sigma subunit (sigma70/sigma32)